MPFTNLGWARGIQNMQGQSLIETFFKPVLGGKTLDPGWYGKSERLERGPTDRDPRLDNSKKNYRLEVREDGRAALWMHNTIIAVYDPADDSLTITTGGWKTLTTKNALSAVLTTAGLGVMWSDRGTWWIGKPGNEEGRIGFADNMVFYPDGRVEGAAPDPAAEKKEMDKHVKGLIAEFEVLRERVHIVQSPVFMVGFIMPGKKSKWLPETTTEAEILPIPGDWKYLAYKRLAAFLVLGQCVSASGGGGPWNAPSARIYDPENERPAWREWPNKTFKRRLNKMMREFSTMKRGPLRKRIEDMFERDSRWNGHCPSAAQLDDVLDVVLRQEKSQTSNAAFGPSDVYVNPQSMYYAAQTQE